MRKPSTRTRTKPESQLLISRALIKKEHHQRFVQLVKAGRENARMAHLLAPLTGAVVPKNIPASIIREFKAAAKRASKMGPRRAIRITR